MHTLARTAPPNEKESLADNSSVFKRLRSHAERLAALKNYLELLERQERRFPGWRPGDLERVVAVGKYIYEQALKR